MPSIEDYAVYLSDAESDSESATSDASSGASSDCADDEADGLDQHTFGPVAPPLKTWLCCRSRPRRHPHGGFRWSQRLGPANAADARSEYMAPLTRPCAGLKFSFSWGMCFLLDVLLFVGVLLFVKVSDPALFDSLGTKTKAMLVATAVVLSLAALAGVVSVLVARVARSGDRQQQQQQQDKGQGKGWGVKWVDAAGGVAQDVCRNPCRRRAHRSSRSSRGAGTCRGGWGGASGGEGENSHIERLHRMYRSAGRAESGATTSSNAGSPRSQLDPRGLHSWV
jgi:hypothetical protein